MSKAIRTGWTSFLDGFYGSFKLAAAIVLAVIGVASAFVNGGLNSHEHQKRGERHTQI
jgi:hypothetical protein